MHKGKKKEKQKPEQYDTDRNNKGHRVIEERSHS